MHIKEKKAVGNGFRQNENLVVVRLGPRVYLVREKDIDFFWRSMKGMNGNVNPPRYGFFLLKEGHEDLPIPNLADAIRAAGGPVD